LPLRESLWLFPAHHSAAERCRGGSNSDLQEWRAGDRDQGAPASAARSAPGDQGRRRRNADDDATLSDVRGQRLTHGALVRSANPGSRSWVSANRLAGISAISATLEPSDVAMIAIWGTADMASMALFASTKHWIKSAGRAPTASALHWPED